MTPEAEHSRWVERGLIHAEGRDIPIRQQR
jgi:hypothetical protein